MWVQKKYKFPVEVIDDVVLDTVQEFPDVYMSGGWVRDKLLGIETTDFDIVAPYDGFHQFTTRFVRLLYQNAPRLKIQLTDFKKKSRTNLPFTPDHFSVVFHFTDLLDRKSKKTYIKIDIKRLHKKKTLRHEYLFRDFSINCLFYNVRKNMFEGEKEDFEDLESELVYPLFSLTKKVDLIRLLRGIRIARSKRVCLSENLKSAMLKSKNILNFHGLGTKKTHHTEVRSPREYMKILSDPETRISQITDLYYYGYLFDWGFYLPETEAVRFEQVLHKHFEKYLRQIVPWKAWKEFSRINSRHSHQSRVLLPSGFLMAVAIVSVMKPFELSKLFLGAVQKVFSAFLITEDKHIAGDAVRELQKDNKGPILRAVKEFSQLVFAADIRAQSIEDLLDKNEESDEETNINRSDSEENS